MPEQYKLMFDDREIVRGTMCDLFDYVHETHSFSFHYGVTEGGYSMESVEAENFMAALSA